jgi:hypothetical protein
MIQEHIDEWGVLQREALLRIQEACPLTARHRGIRIFRLLITPSFLNPVCWELVREAVEAKTTEISASSSFRVEYAVWRQDLDQEKFSNPINRLRYPKPVTPTIERTGYAVADDLAAGWISRFAGLTLPALIQTGFVGCDGTAFEFSWGDSFLGARFHWWEQAPAPWTSLGQTFHEVLREFEALPAND